MDRNNYFIVFPNGDKQQIAHRLSFGDIVDINGKIYRPKDLDPKKIAYSVNGLRKKIDFKDVYWFFPLKLLMADEVKIEKDFGKQNYKKEKLDETFDKLLKQVEKRYKKKRGR